MVPDQRHKSSTNTTSRNRNKTYFIAINRHPYHNRDFVLNGLKVIAKASPSIRKTLGGNVSFYLFWHGGNVPSNISDIAKRNSIKVVNTDHTTNGQNLNFQIAYATRLRYKVFFRVDADDTVTSGRFKAQANALETHDMVGAGLHYSPQYDRGYVSQPNEQPTVRDYIENRFLLHPTLAFNLDVFNKFKLHYWPKRLEDKALYLDALQANIRIKNILMTAGDYNLPPSGRDSLNIKLLGFQLNIRAIFQKKCFHLAPYAALILLLSIFLGNKKMRVFRHLMYK